MTAEQLAKYFADLGYQPTPGQRRFIEAMDREGKRRGEALNKSILRANSMLSRRVR